MSSAAHDRERFKRRSGILNEELQHTTAAKRNANSSISPDPNQQQDVGSSGGVVGSPKQSSTKTVAVKTRLQHLASIDLYEENKLLRKTSIVCSIGRDCSSIEAILNLRSAGINGVMIDLAHNDRHFHEQVINNLRASYIFRPGPQIPIAIELKGNAVRVGKIKSGSIEVQEGQNIRFTVDKQFENSSYGNQIYVNYPGLPENVKPKDMIYTELCGIEMVVLEIGSDYVVVKAYESGTIRSQCKLLLPGIKLDFPELGREDIDDIRWGVDQGIDLIIDSVKTPSKLSAIHNLVGHQYSRYVKIFAKIDTKDGLTNFDEILEMADGIMIARGDIGVEIPPEKVFLAQKMMAAKCNLTGKSSCTSQMLLSMINGTAPTRNEVSDVANAVLDGVDCVTLTAETIHGNKIVSVMNRICAEAESVMFHRQTFQELLDYHSKKGPFNDTEETVAISAVYAAYAQKATAIVCLTESGRSAAMVSKYRPPCPVLAVTREDRVTRSLLLHRGILPITFPKPNLDGPFQDDIDARIGWCVAVAKHAGYVNSGDTIIGIQGWKEGGGNTNTIRVLIVD